MRPQGALLASVLLLAACGGGRLGPSEDLRARLASAEGRVTRERAPDVVAEVESALSDAEAAERAGEVEVAADHLTRARLLLDAAEAEAARIADEQERQRLEARLAEVTAQARRDEAARERIAAELARLAAARAAREEAQQALALAERDEARPSRRARVSLDDAQDVRRAAQALRARARLAEAAARALGASAEVLAPIEEALSASERARNDPLVALAAADRAHAASLRALGGARRAAPSPGPDAPRALAEAAQAAGLEVVSLPEGLAVEAEGLFAGATPRGPRVERLAALLAAHPHGPVQVQVQASASARGSSLAAQRAEALRRALVAAGADATRLQVSALPVELAADATTDRARLVFRAYAR